MAATTTGRSRFDQPLSELFQLVNQSTAKLKEAAALQDAFLNQLETGSGLLAERFNSSGARAGAASYETLLKRPAPRKDLQLPKVVQLDPTETRVRVYAREPIDFARLPQPRPPMITRKRPVNVQPGWGVHPLDQQKSLNLSAKQEERSLAITSDDLLINQSFATREEQKDRQILTIESANPKASENNAHKKPPPPPKRGSSGLFDASKQETALQLDESRGNEHSGGKRLPPPRPEQSPKTEQDNNEMMIEETSRKPPPPPRRASVEDSSLPNLPSMESKPKPPPIPKRHSSEDVLLNAKPPSEPPPVKPPPPPRRSDLGTSMKTKHVERTTSTETPSSASTASGGGLAARQAMLANMLAGGGSRGSSPQPSGVANKTEPGMKTSSTEAPKQELRAPKSLGEDAALASAASALQSKLGSSAKPDLGKYQKMQKAGLPQGAIEHAMRKDGVDPKLLFS